jgi:hypothetical protein
MHHNSHSRSRDKTMQDTGQCVALHVPYACIKDQYAQDCEDEQEPTTRQTTQHLLLHLHLYSHLNLHPHLNLRPYSHSHPHLHLHPSLRPPTPTPTRIHTYTHTRALTTHPHPLPPNMHTHTHTPLGERGSNRGWQGQTVSCSWTGTCTGQLLLLLLLACEYPDEFRATSCCCLCCFCGCNGCCRRSNACGGRGLRSTLPCWCMRGAKLPACINLLLLHLQFCENVGHTAILNKQTCGPSMLLLSCW